MNSDLHNEFGRAGSPVKQKPEPGWRLEELGFLGSIKRFGRYIGVLALSVVAFLMLGAVYLFFAAASYTATATVMFVPDLDQFRNQALFDIDIETHSALIESDEILTMVLEEAPIALTGQGEGMAVSRMNDIRDAFERPPLTVTNEILEASRNGSAADGTSSDSSEQGQDPVLLTALRERVDVERVGQSKLLNISFTAEDPSVAVTMANTLARTYSRNSINASIDNTLSPSNQLVQDLLQNRGLGGTDPNGAETPSEQRNIQSVKLATLASAKSSPNVNIVLAVSVMIGLIVGLSIAAGLEFRKTNLRFET